MTTRRHRIWLCLGGGFVLGLVGLVPKPDVTLDVQWSVPALAPESYLPSARTDTGEELALIFVGSSRCRWSNRPELPGLVRQAKLAIRDRAQAEEVGFVAIGIARDAVASAGIRHLAEYGDFDELTAGRGWLNAGVLRYVFNELPGPAATPQIIVVRRDVVVNGGQRTIGNERVVVRIVGFTQIRDWVESGMAL